MTELEGITNQEELGSSETKGSTSAQKKSSGTGEITFNSGKNSEKNEALENESLTPLDIANKTYWNSEEKLNKTKAQFWSTLTNIIKVLGIIIGFAISIFTIFWAYKLSSIAEPIGGIKVEMANIKQDNVDIKDSIQKTNDKLDGLTNRILDKKISN